VSTIATKSLTWSTAAASCDVIPVETAVIPSMESRPNAAPSSLEAARTQAWDTVPAERATGIASTRSCIAASSASGTRCRGVPEPGERGESRSRCGLGSDERVESRANRRRRRRELEDPSCSRTSRRGKPSCWCSSDTPRVGARAYGGLCHVTLVPRAVRRDGVASIRSPMPPPWPGTTQPVSRRSHAPSRAAAAVGAHPAEDSPQKVPGPQQTIPTVAGGLLRPPSSVAGATRGKG
jgi:hypothetical protein